MSEERLVAEALRVYRRYQMEIVEGLRLCPWAERARREGAVVERVLLTPVPDVALTLTALSELEGYAHVEIGLLLFPCVSVDRKDFERFVAAVTQADADRREPGNVPFALAAFHPDAPVDASVPDRLVPFLRRTPDPTIQLVRMSALDRVRRGDAEGTQFVDVRFFMDQPPQLDGLSLRNRIARANLDTVKRVGIEEVERRFLDIRRDRDESYRRIAANAEAECRSS